MIGSDKISDLEIERFVQKELSAERAAEIERLREEDSALSVRIAAVIVSNEEILSAYPPRQMAARIAEAAESQKKERSRTPMIAVLSAVGAAAAATVLTLVISSEVQKPSDITAPSFGDSSEYIGIKGRTEPTLFVFRKGAKGDERLLSGQTAKAGDVLQLKYAAKGAKFGVIFSIDGRGTVTLHYPSSAEVPSTLESKGTHPLSYSYELDDAPNFERFFFITADHPIDLNTVIEKAKTEKPGITKRLSLDPTLSQCDFVLKKTR